MAIDKVRPLKMEEPGSGTETDVFPTEVDPSEDYVSTKGISLEGLETHVIDRVGNDIQFTDPTVGTKSVDDVRSTARISSSDTTPGNLLSKLVAGAGIILTKLSPGSNETLEIKSTSADPFAIALFDDCTPLFDKDDTCNIELLEECG